MMAATNPPNTAGPHKRIDLRIQFRSERDGKPIIRGTEVVSYDFNDDGSIIFRATSRSDSPQVTRDVVYTLAPNYRPRDAFVRLQVDGRYEGAGWFRFQDGLILSTTQNHQSGGGGGGFKIDGTVTSFCAHPVSTDVLVAAAYEHAGPKRQTPKNMFLSSPDPFGRTGPVLAESKVALEYVGREALETPAGRFLADHYLLFSTPDAAEPLEDLWAMPDTFVFLQARARGVFNTTYELTEFRAELR